MTVGGTEPGLSAKSAAEVLAEVKFVPGPILLMGAPGAGKGTQAKEIMAAWGIPQISTGDLLRLNKQRGTELGLAAKQIMAEGKLVPDDLVNQMVASRLREPDCARGYILDGFPRTIVQAEWLDHHLASQVSVLPLIAVSIRVDYNKLLRRITGRRSCPLCGTIYNVYLQTPKAAERCDLDGAQLVRRPDDTEEVFEERMRTFASQTAPVVEHYRALGQFQEVDGEQPVEVVTAAIVAAVEKFRGI